MIIDDPTNIEELARSLEEPLLPHTRSEDDNGTAEDVDSAGTASDDIGDHGSDQEVPVLYDGLPLKDSLLIKSLYFLDALGSSAWGRFSAIYYNSHGLNTQQIGVIEGLRTFTPTISGVFWGFVSDRFRCRKLVWVWTKSGGTMILLLLAMPSVTKSFFRILSVSVGAQLFVSNGAILDSYTLEMLGTKNKLLYGRYRLYASLSWGLGSIVMGWITDHYGFDWNFIMFGGLSILMIVLVSYYIPDKIETNYQEELGSSDRGNDDREERIEEGEGGGEGNDADPDVAEHDVAGPDIAGPDVADPDIADPFVEPDADPNVDPDIVSNVDPDIVSNADLDIVSNADLTDAGPTTGTDSHADLAQPGDISELLFLIIKPRVIFFFLEVLVMGAAMATVERLLFLYMVNDLFASTLLCGLSVGVNVLFELPIFWYASSILNYLGSDGMFLLSMTCFVVRVFGYTLLTPSTKWWILALESMHGVTFATFWIVTTDISKVLIDQSKGGYWSTTIPSFVQMLYTAVGATIGSVLGGYAMHRYGSREMYRFTAGSVFCMLLFHLLGGILVRTCCRQIGSILPECSHQAETGNDEEVTDDQDDVEIEDDSV